MQSFANTNTLSLSLKRKILYNIFPGISGHYYNGYKRKYRYFNFNILLVKYRLYNFFPACKILYMYMKYASVLGPEGLKLPATPQGYMKMKSFLYFFLISDFRVIADLQHFFIFTGFRHV